MKQSFTNVPSFTSFQLAPAILQAISKKGYTTPSAIQAKVIPSIMQGRNVIAAAQTGTGKTAGFTLPILHSLSQGAKVRTQQVRALILTPTRELAAQVEQSVRDYGHGLNLHSHVVFGGVNIKPQIHKLAKGTDILIATPGRLLDLYRQGAMNFRSLEALVLDEADRMLDMGFIVDIKKIIKLLPVKRQNLLFSATLSREIRLLAKAYVTNPVEISVTPTAITVEAIKQIIYPVNKSHKLKLLIKLIKENNWIQALIFSRTKHGANRLARRLEKADISADAIHGNKSQSARTRALAGFKNGRTQILVATDIASRGLDISQLPQVVNYDLPDVPEDYVHRIGRTGRAGASGCAISLVSSDERKQLMGIEKLTGQRIPQVMIQGFAPDVEAQKTGASRQTILQQRGNLGKNSRTSKSGKNGNLKSDKLPAWQLRRNNKKNIKKHSDTQVTSHPQQWL